MGQKVDPRCFRIAPTLGNNWNSIYYTDKKNYGIKLLQDLEIRKLISSRYSTAQVGKVHISYFINSVTVNIHAKKPGIIIGRSGVDIDKLKSEIKKIIKMDVSIDIHEIKRPFLNAAIVAQNIALQIQNRGSFRKAMKSAIQYSLKQGCRGIKIQCSGRLMGVDIARAEKYKEGRVPLHTLRSNIDYATYEALTTYGIIGIKVWIYVNDFTDL